MSSEERMRRRGGEKEKRMGKRKRVRGGKEKGKKEKKEEGNREMSKKKPQIAGNLEESIKILGAFLLKKEK